MKNFLLNTLELSILFTTFALYYFLFFDVNFELVRVFALIDLGLVFVFLVSIKDEE
jgi:hypothetical protein